MKNLNLSILQFDSGIHIRYLFKSRKNRIFNLLRVSYINTLLDTSPIHVFDISKLPKNLIQLHKTRNMHGLETFVP